MGTYLSSLSDDDQRKQQLDAKFLGAYTSTNLSIVRDSLAILRDVHGGKSAINYDEFDEVFGHEFDDPEPHWEFWSEAKPRTDVYRVMTGMCAFGQAKLHQKIEFLFELFDFNQDGYLSMDELCIFINSSLRGLSMLAGLEIDSEKEREAVLIITTKFFQSLARAPNQSITQQELEDWIMGNRAVLIYIQEFCTNKEREAEAMIEVHRRRWGQLKVNFDKRAMGEDTIVLAVAMKLIQNYTVTEPLTIKEVTQIAGLIDDHGFVYIDDFEALCRGILAFDICDRHGDGFLHLNELRVLVWVGQWVPPTQEQLEIATESMNEHNTDLDDTIDRMEWINFSAKPRNVATTSYVYFHRMMKDLFDRFDADGSFSLDLNQFQEMLVDSFNVVLPVGLLVNGNERSKDEGLLGVLPEAQLHPNRPLTRESMDRASATLSQVRHATRPPLTRVHRHTLTADTRIDKKLDTTRSPHARDASTPSAAGQARHASCLPPSPAKGALGATGATGAPGVKSVSPEELLLMERKKQLCSSLACALARELFTSMHKKEHEQINWVEVKTNLELIWGRLQESTAWVHDFKTNHFSRLFSFSVDGSGSIERADLVLVMMSHLQAPLDYGILSEQEAGALSEYYADKIMAVVDDDKSGTIEPLEMNRHLDDCLKIEKQLVDHVESVRCKPKKKLQADRQSGSGT